MTTHEPTTTRVLRSGALVEVDAKGHAEFLTCSWLVQVDSGNPEPDFPEDCYKIVDCGARVFSLDGRADLEHTTCEAGHVRHAYGSPEQQVQEMDEWMAERREAGF